MLTSNNHRTDHRFPLDYLNISGEDLYGIAHVTGWEPYDLYDLANISRVEVCTLLLRTDHAHYIITPGTGSTADDLNDLTIYITICSRCVDDVDRDLPEVR